MLKLVENQSVRRVHIVFPRNKAEALYKVETVEITRGTYFKGIESGPADLKNARVRYADCSYSIFLIAEDRADEYLEAIEKAVGEQFSNVRAKN